MTGAVGSEPRTWAVSSPASATERSISLGERKLGQQIDQHVERGAGLLLGRVLGEEATAARSPAGRVPIADHSRGPQAASHRRAGSAW